jgi:L-ascorbate metabolism protein UlaG (beta-lactamase superfamily)
MQVKFKSLIGQKILFLICCVLVCNWAQSAEQSSEQSVELTWMSIANWYIKIGDKRIVMDGYITRIPGAPFFYAPKDTPGDQYAYTKTSYGVDVASIKKVRTALLGDNKLDYLMVGHSHWDHSWDTPTWSKITGAPIIGGISTCYQAEAQHVLRANCQSVSGGEKINLGNGVTLRVVRFNHSGDTKNPIQHFARELYRPPFADAKGRFKAGVAEDYPNGGGNRAYLFTVDKQGGGVISFFINSSASAYDLEKDIVVDGVNYGSPLNNLRSAVKDAGLDHVDVWIGTGGKPVAELIVPVLNPVTYIPHHWDGLFNSFWRGIPYPFKDDALKEYLDSKRVALMPQKQYFDTYKLRGDEVTMSDNHLVKSRLGFSDVQTFGQGLVEVVNRTASTSQGDDCGETDAMFSSGGQKVGFKD